jgi:WD40 repeat protein
VIRSVGLTQMVRSMHLSGGRDGSGGEGSMMAFGGMGGSAFLVDVGSGRWTELTGHLAHVQAVQFTCDSRWLLTACRSVLEVWDVDGHFDPTEDPLHRSKILSTPVALAWKQS